MGSDGPASAGTTGRLDMTMMLVVHDAFRRDLAHLARAADRRPADLDDPACHTAVLAGWEVFRTQLHLHHTGEDRRLWPRMRDHLAGRPDELAMLQAMQDEHARIDPLLAAVDGDLADRDRGPARLGERVDALATELSGHLAHEERDALPLLDRVLPVAEWQRFAADERRARGIRGAAQLFPWLLDCASTERTQAVLRQFPPPLRVVYRRIWQPRYARHDHWESAMQAD